MFGRLYQSRRQAISQGGGARVAMALRAPCVRMRSAMEAMISCGVKNRKTLISAEEQTFGSTTSFGNSDVPPRNPTVAGKNVYLRLVCFSVSDAMGMNMVNKGILGSRETLP
jgi:hydroxymethylglutaryl-CoA reductase